MTFSPIPGTTSASMLLPTELSASHCKGSCEAPWLFHFLFREVGTSFSASSLLVTQGEKLEHRPPEPAACCSALPVPEPPPSQSCHFCFLSCGWTPSSSVPTNGFQSSCPKERQKKQDPDARTWRMTSGPGVSNCFCYCSPSQTMISSFSFTNTDLACITPTGKTTLPFMLFLGKEK